MNKSISPTKTLTNFQFLEGEAIPSSETVEHSTFGEPMSEQNDYDQWGEGLTT